VVLQRPPAEDRHFRQLALLAFRDLAALDGEEERAADHQQQHEEARVDPVKGGGHGQKRK